MLNPCQNAWWNMKEVAHLLRYCIIKDELFFNTCMYNSFIWWNVGNSYKEYQAWRTRGTRNMSEILSWLIWSWGLCQAVCNHSTGCSLQRLTGFMYLLPNRLTTFAAVLIAIYSAARPTWHPWTVSHGWIPVVNWRASGFPRGISWNWPHIFKVMSYKPSQII